MQRDNNIFEHDYIIEALEMFAADLKAAKFLSSIIDKHACIITAFMQGQVLATEKAAFSAGQADNFRESPALLDEARRYLAINVIPTGSRQNESQEYILIRKLVSSLQRGGGMR